MSLKAKDQPATYADIEALPRHLVGQILYGALHAHPRPAPRHGWATNVIAYEITGPFQMGRGGPGGWVFIGEPELHLGSNVIVPDIAGWRKGRLPRLPETAWLETPPDWVCEVLSPSTQRIDRTDKLAIYAEFGIGHCWYVDPLARTLEVLARQGNKWLIAATFKDNDEVTAPPFEAHSFSLGLLWPPQGEAGG